MTGETEKFLDKARQSIKASKVLLEEHLLEDAVSRAYYAMFYSASAALSSKSVFTQSHKGMIIKFNELFVRPGVFSKETGRMLKDAFQKRQTFDYTLSYNIDQEETARLVNLSEEFFIEIEIFLTKESS